MFRRLEDAMLNVCGRLADDSRRKQEITIGAIVALLISEA